MEKESFNEIINKSIDINAPVSKVWNTLTNPDLMKLWISDSDVNVFSECKVGGKIAFSGLLHIITYESNGTILQFEPEKLFQYTHWDTLSGLADRPENYSIITFGISSTADKTTLSLTQANFITEIIFKHFNFYWNGTLAITKRLNER